MLDALQVILVLQQQGASDLIDFNFDSIGITTALTRSILGLDSSQGSLVLLISLLLRALVSLNHLLVLLAVLFFKLFCDLFAELFFSLTVCCWLFLRRLGLLELLLNFFLLLSARLLSVLSLLQLTFNLGDVFLELSHLGAMAFDLLL